MVHYLKTWPIFFEEVLNGNKTFEIRKENDRVFNVGDILVLEEYTVDSGYTGRSVIKEVTYVLRDLKFVKEGFVVMGLN